MLTPRATALVCPARQSARGAYRGAVRMVEERMVHRRIGDPESILVIHNRYRQRGGEDVMFEAECALLEQHGHRVERLVSDNASIRDPATLRERVSLGVATVWSRDAARLVRRAVRRARPSVVHAHNTFPLLSPSIYAACVDAGVPVVQTLHNFRLVCPKATLFRDGAPCHNCVGRRLAWPGVLHACYQDSRPRSAVVAAMLAVNRAAGSWGRVSAFIALSKFARDILIDGGLPADRLFVKPNFVEPDPGGHLDDSGAFLFAGRLSEEKGIATLLAAWRHLPGSVRLRVIGDGPLRGEVRRAAEQLPNLEYHGPADRSEVIGAMRSARALIVPSLWYEGSPVTVIEAFGCGTPVIASDIGTLTEMAAGHDAAILVRPNDPDALASAVHRLDRDPVLAASLGSQARQEYLTRYRGTQSYETLMEVYRSASADRNEARQAQCPP
jgi:glycosyltransferase involved in cell wall biosynthesis